MNNIDEKGILDQILANKPLIEFNVPHEITISTNKLHGRKVDAIIIENCHFLLPVYLQDLQIKFAIKFINCTFEKDLVIFNTTISEHDQKINFNNDSILIKNTDIKGHLSLHTNNNILRDLKLEGNNNTINKLSITGFRSTEGGFEVSNYIINNIFRFDSNLFLRGITFESNTVKDQVRFVGNNTSGYDFLRNTFENDIWIRGCLIESGIIFNDGLFKKDLRIRGIRPKNDDNLSITFSGSRFEDKVIVEYEENAGGNNINQSGFREIAIGSTTFKNGISFVGAEDQDVLFSLQSIDLRCSNKLVGEIIFKGFIIEEAIIVGLNIDAAITFSYCEFDKVQINELSNYDTIKFMNAKSWIGADNSCFSITNSYLGQTEFINVDLSSFDEIKVEHSDLKDIKASHITWFHRSQLNQETNVESRSWFERVLYSFLIKIKLLFFNFPEDEITVTQIQNNRETYRQLKQAMESSGNRIQALTFKQAELKEYISELWYTKTIFNKDRLILELSRTNNHGQSWTKPLYWLLGITVLFSCFLLIGNSELLSYYPSLRWNDIKKTIEILWDGYKVYPQLLNPAQSLKDIFGLNPNNASILLSLFIIYKVIYAFFIFQIISAFRKYHKS